MRDGFSITLRWANILRNRGSSVPQLLLQQADLFLIILHGSLIMVALLHVMRLRLNPSLLGLVTRLLDLLSLGILLPAISLHLSEQLIIAGDLLRVLLLI